MKRILFATAALCALAAPAYAQVVSTMGDCAAGTSWCLVAPDSDDLKMFIDKPKPKTNSTIFGSVGTNDNGLDDIQIGPQADIVTDGSDFANIKPAKDTVLESVTFTPLIGAYDGFFIAAQLRDNFTQPDSKCGKRGQPACLVDPSVAQYFITVDGTGGVTGTFSFTQDFSQNVNNNGFDELIETTPGQLISSVTVWIDTTGLDGTANPDVSFKELKHVLWSPCDTASLCDTVGGGSTRHSS